MPVLKTRITPKIHGAEGPHVSSFSTPSMLGSRSEHCSQVLVPLVSAAAVIMLCLAGVSKPWETSQPTRQGSKEMV